MNATKTAVALFLALVAILVPVDASVVPDEIGAIAGTVPASAQTPTPTFDGNPQPCPASTAPLSASPNVCVGEWIPCPGSPFDAARRMGLSPEYVDFCVEHIVNDDTLVADSAGVCILASGLALSDCTPSTLEYGECPTNRRDLGRLSKANNYSSDLWGTVVEVFEVGDSFVDSGVTYTLQTDFCRITAFRDCAVGLRVGRNTCRHVVRRTWQCPSGSFPLNDWNRCYREPTGGYVGDLPCAAGAPDFPVLSCDDYVSQDFLPDPSLVTCVSLAMVDNPQSNDHWCQFDAAELDIECHTTGAACPQQLALCLKRASNTGGCRRVGDVIACAPLQAAYIDALRASLTPAAIQLRLEAALQASCEPCVILPFRPLTTDFCAPDAFGPGATDDSISRCLEQVFAHSADLTDCSTAAAAPVVTPDRQYCGDPAVGHLGWRPTHPSRLAIVGTAVVISIDNVPVDYVQPDPSDSRGWTAVFEDIPEPSPGLTQAQLQDYYESHVYQEFNFVPSAEFAYASVPLIANQRHNPRRCRVWQLPRFRIAVRELWPDNPQDENQLRSLFGAQALDWWTTGLTTLQQKERTEARGLAYWPDLATQAEQDAELARRDVDLGVELMCNVEAGANAWCRWHPSRPGYYQLIGRGAWQMRAESSIVSDRGVGELSEPTAATASSGVVFGNYTETEPIGIAVHEIRVSTRLASR